MVYAIDFDGVLSDVRMQQVTKRLISERNEVWVITKRRKNEKNEDLQLVLDKIKLPIFKVIFTERKAKSEFLKAINADFFIDNNDEEFAEINHFTSIIPLKY
jgi:hypothetical protein